jgi:hypothetical protein
MFKENEVLTHYENMTDTNNNNIKFHTQRIPLKYDKEHMEFIGILGISRDVNSLDI